jgi:MYXO-CTERM domain-containing protein
LLSDRTIPIRAWSHVAFVYDGASGTLAFFVNGEETNRTVSAPGTLDGSGGTLRIGGPGDTPACPPTGHGSFDGLIDELEISNIARYGDFPPAPGEDGGVEPGEDGGPGTGRDGGRRRPGGWGDGGPDSGVAATDGGSSGADGGSGGGSGGCAASGGAGALPVAALGVLALVLAWRRSRR